MVVPELVPKSPPDVISSDAEPEVPVVISSEPNVFVVTEYFAVVRPSFKPVHCMERTLPLALDPDEVANLVDGLTGMCGYPRDRFHSRRLSFRSGHFPYEVCIPPFLNFSRYGNQGL